jgi:hypothetical protein
MAEGEVGKGQRLPSKPGRGTEAVAGPQQGLLEGVPQKESGLHGEESYGSKGAQPEEAIRGRDCKDGRADCGNCYYFEGLQFRCTGRVVLMNE